MQGQYSLRSPAVKRLMKEAQELREPTEQYHAQPLEDNLFEWHFTIRGPDDSEFKGGIYHGRIVLPPDYPMKPPSIIVLTANGRFEINTKICLSISGHHPESWQPSWSIRTALLAIIGFMPTHGGGAIGSLEYTPDERKILAKRTLEWKCPNCGSLTNILRPVTDASKADSQEAKELASQINFQGEKKKTESESGPSAESSGAEAAPAIDQNSGTSSPAHSATSEVSSPGLSPPPWQGPWPPFPSGPTAGMPRFPFMPFGSPMGSQPPPGMPTTTTSGPFPRPMMPFPQMAAMHAAMRQMHMARGAPQNYSFPSWPPGAFARFPMQPTPPGFTSSPAGSVSNDQSQATTSRSLPATSSGSSTIPTASTTSLGSSNPESIPGGTASQQPNASTKPPAKTPTSTESSQNTAGAAGPATSSSPSPDTTRPAEGSGVRQRTSAPSQPRAPSVTTSTQPAELPRHLQQRQRSSSRVTKAVMVILALAILMLLLRRLVIMNIIKFDQDADF